MSWLTGLADKAENLLNKIDQNAAAVLQEKDKKQSPLKQIFVDQEIVTNKLLPPTDNIDNNLLNIKKYNGNSDGAKSSNEAHRKTPPDKVTLSQNSSFVDFSYIFDSDEQGDGLNIKKNNNGANKVLFDDTNNLNINKDDDDNDNLIQNNLVNVENQMLKNEIFEATNEASLLLSKLKGTEKINENLKQKVSQLENIYSMAKQENDVLSLKLNALKTVKERKQSFHNEELLELESTIKNIEQDKMVLSEKVRELEGYQVIYSSMKSELENNIITLKNNCDELENQLKIAKQETINAIDELKNYKIRANTTLAMKDKIIEDLKSSLPQDQTDIALTSQITQLRMECDELHREILSNQTEYENKTREVMSLDAKVKSLERQLTVVREGYQQEKSAKEFAEHSVNSLTKELKNLQLETGKQLSSLRSKLRDNQFKENEKMQQANVSSSDRNNLKIAESGDDRYRSLTHALVAKQTALESVTADRNALRLQLEKTENKYRSDLVNIRNSQSRIISLNYTDDVKARMPLMEESPWDSNLSRRVKKAYSSLDSFSVRIGVFLRRNPLARIFIIAYMVILHLWVFIVLFTYKPEIH